MDERSLNDLFAAKERRRQALARLPIEEKIRVVVRLQALAAPLLRRRGRTVRCWMMDPPRDA